MEEAKRKKIKLPKDVRPPIDERLSDMKDQEDFVEYMEKTIQHSKDKRSEWRDKLPNWYNQYKGLVKEKSFPWKGCSNLHIPITAIIVDTMVSRMINPLTAVSPFVTASGVSIPGPDKKGMTDHDRATQIVEPLLHDVLERKIDVYPIIHDWVKANLIYGQAYVKVVWHKERCKFTRILNQKDVQNEVRVAQASVERGDATDNDLKFLEEMVFILESHDWEKKPLIRIEREETVYDNPMWVFIPAEDVFPHPRSRKIENSPYVGHRFYETMDEIIEQAQYYKYDDEAVRHIQSWGAKEHEEKDLITDVQELYEGVDHSSDMENDDKLNSNEMIEWHGRYDIDKDGRLENVVGTYHRATKRLVAASEAEQLHGKRPFAGMKAFPMPGRFESEGIPEMICDLQQEINDIHNQRIDNGTIINAPMFKFDPAGDIDLDIHRVAPGQGFPDPTMELLQTGEVKLSSFREEELVRRLIQDRLGITDFAIGNDQTAIQNKTATGIQNVVNEGNQRLELLLKNVRAGIKEAVVQTWQLLQQYSPDQIQFRVVEDANESITTVSAREIQGMWDIDLHPNSVNTNKTALLQELEAQIQVGLQAGPQHVSLKPLLKSFYRRMGSKQIEQIVTSEQETLMRFVQENPEVLAELIPQFMALANQAGVDVPTPEDGPPIEEQKLAFEMESKGRELDIQKQKVTGDQLLSAAKIIAQVLSSVSQNKRKDAMMMVDMIKSQLQGKAARDQNTTNLLQVAANAAAAKANASKETPKDNPKA